MIIVINDNTIITYYEILNFLLNREIIVTKTINFLMDRMLGAFSTIMESFTLFAHLVALSKLCKQKKTKKNHDSFSLN